jgi:hypothetical protein
MPGGPSGSDDGSGPGGRPRSSSSLTSWASGNRFYVKADIEIKAEADQKLRVAIEAQSIRMRGVADVSAMSGARWHELAATANRLKAKPVRGTFLIDDESQGAFRKTFVSRSPSQRVGWMANLLPFLGKDDVFAQIETNKPWRSDKNLLAGGTWIPQFVNPSYPRSSWQARVPSLPEHALGATHFVGLGGIGNDAAEYPDGDPATAKKLGMFGYNRETRFSDVADGLSNTIFMIQVPPSIPRPWIAGGGATIQGVPEQNSFAPFSSMQANGKKGTYALMADGSVRFIADTIPDKVFQALVTRAGSDDASEMNSFAPKIEGGAEPLKPKAPAPLAPPAGGDGKAKPPDSPAPPEK